MPICACAKTDSTESGSSSPATILRARASIWSSPSLAGAAVLGAFTLDGEGAMELLRQELEGGGLQGVPVGHERLLVGTASHHQCSMALWMAAMMLAVPPDTHRIGLSARAARIASVAACFAADHATTMKSESLASLRS